MWNSYSFQPVGQWMGYLFTELGAEGCCHSLNALLLFFYTQIPIKGERNLVDQWFTISSFYMLYLYIYVHIWFRHFHKNIHSWVENECCFPRTVNIPNINLTTNIYTYIYTYVYIHADSNVWDLPSWWHCLSFVSVTHYAWHLGPLLNGQPGIL